MMLPIDTTTLPEDGKHISGELTPDVFGLDGDRDVISCGPLVYDLNLQMFESELYISGVISSTFVFRCARCLKSFAQTIEIPDLHISVPSEDQPVVDLAELLREELVLLFPPYPNCQLADDPTPCELDKTYLVVDSEGDDGVKPPSLSGEKGIWDALDTLADHDSGNNKS